MLSNIMIFLCIIGFICAIIGVILSIKDKEQDYFYYVGAALFIPILLLIVIKFL